MNRLFILLLITAAFTACKKEDKTVTPLAPERPIPYLAKTTYWDPGLRRLLPHDTFSLNANGDIVVVGLYKSDVDGPYYLDNFQHNSNGNIVGASGYMHNDRYITFTYEYDLNNNISKRTANGTLYGTLISKYSYDTNNRLVREEEIYGYNNTIRRVREYTYSDNTLNPSTMKVTDEQGLLTEYIYTYDNKPTPYSTLPKIVYYMGAGELGVNNVLSVSVRYENNTTSYLYRYDANNLPFDKQDNKGSQYKYYYGNR